ncbi:MAG: hypothetical protein JWL83_287, partial [Actinomycetia bacterium]|nr:hypothetical protein [Actinomycetes bacterium]
GEWQADGFVSSASWLRERCHLSHGDATSAVKLARTLEEMPAVADAFAAGDISRRHAQVISLARAPERGAPFAQLDGAFAAAARTLDPLRLRSLVRHV